MQLPRRRLNDAAPVIWNNVHTRLGGERLRQGKFRPGTFSRRRAPTGRRAEAPGEVETNGWDTPEPVGPPHVRRHHRGTDRIGRYDFLWKIFPSSHSCEFERGYLHHPGSRTIRSSGDEIRAALKFVAELANQQYGSLPHQLGAFDGQSTSGSRLITEILPRSPASPLMVPRNSQASRRD